MLEEIQHIIQQDMNIGQGLAAFAILLTGVAWCWWQEQRERRATFAIAKAAARPMLAYAVEEIERQGEQIAEHERTLYVLTREPDQEAIDAAIAEADEEDAEAEEPLAPIARRMIA